MLTPSWDLNPGVVYAATPDGTDVGSTPSFGGLAFTRSGSVAATVQTAHGRKVLRGGAVDGSGTNAYFTASLVGSLPRTVAMVIDVNLDAAEFSYQARMQYGAWQGIVVQPTDGVPEMWNPGSTAYPLIPGQHILVVVDNTTTVSMYLDGELLETGTWTSARTIAQFRLGWWGDLYRAAGWTTAMSGPDVVSMTAELAAIHAPLSPWTATCEWNIDGSAALTSSQWEPPTLPDATPGGAATPPATPEPQLPPAGVPDPVVRRISEVMPAPPVDEAGAWQSTGGVAHSWQPTAVVDEPWGRFQVVVEGVDITYLWGCPLPVPTWSRVEPFGSAAATIEIPQITPFHVLPPWCVPGANVDINLVRISGSVQSRFAGVVTTFGHRADRGVFTLECSGVVFADDLQLRQPAFLTAPRDIGTVVAEVLNATPSKRHGNLTHVVTGCMSGVLGGWEPKVTGYVSQLLATAVTGGRQWTVACPVRDPALVLKDTTTIGWTVSNGQRGITVDLVQDWSKAPNVLFGSGIGPDGGRWQNAKYPNWRPDETPAYPFTNPSTTIRLGVSDAATDTGNGVSLWQARVGLPVTGVYSQADRQRCFQVQASAGIQQDGIVGPQTWAATFGTGSNTGTLDCFYMPIAFSPQVMPRAYGPDGDDLGPNPAYDPDVLRVEDKIDFGQGVGKAEGVRAAQEILARDIHPGWTGTVTFELDPEERSRFEVSEGSNGQIRYFRGETLTVHTARVDYTGTTVTAAVDTNARDYPTLRDIRDRERNATDPAKSRVRRLTAGQVGTDRATFDAESPAGQVPRHALFGDLWTVIRVPFGSYGTVVRTELTTTGPTPFAVAVFDRPLTAADMLSLVGNPLTASSNPWSENADALSDAGLLMSWGWARQPAGYYPGEYTDPDGDTSAPATGRLVDDASWEYASGQVPWLWVAEIAASSCHIEGRFWPGAD